MTQNNRVQRELAPERLGCTTLLNRWPGTWLDALRNPPGAILGWLARSERKLRQTADSLAYQAPQIRGAQIAVDYVLEALLRHSERVDFSFLVDASRLAEFHRAASTYPRRNDGPSIAIRASTELLQRDSPVTQPDIWLDPTGNMAYITGLREQVSSRAFPIVSLQHGLSEHAFLYERFLRAMLTPSYSWDSFVCSSRACKKALTNILRETAASFNQQFGADLQFKGRLDVIPLCVDTDTFRPGDKLALRRRLGIPKEAIVLLYLGYLALMKADLTPLLATVRRLADQHASVELVLAIAGTGPDSYKRSLQELVRELKLEKRVIMFRDISDLQKTQLLGAADVFVAPCDSVAESFGLTPVEAMACGLPQVVADWSGYRDTVVDGETGFLVPTSWGRCDSDFCGTGTLFGWAYDHNVLGQSVALDAYHMEDRLRLLIRNPQLRAQMSERSRTRAVAEFSYESVARRYDELFADLATSAPKTRRPSGVRRFDQPAYFDFFGHFATRELSLDRKLRKGNSGTLSLGILLRPIQTAFPKMPVFDESLLEQILRTVCDADMAMTCLTVGQLIELMESEARSCDRIKRHVLFLLKHGKIIMD